jgi:predicted transposase YdaD
MVEGDVKGREREGEGEGRARGRNEGYLSNTRGPAGLNSHQSRGSLTL